MDEKGLSKRSGRTVCFSGMGVGILLGSSLFLSGCTTTAPWSSDLILPKEEKGLDAGRVVPLDASPRNVVGWECEESSPFSKSGSQSSLSNEVLRSLKENVSSRATALLNASGEWTDTNYGLWHQTCVHYKGTPAKILPSVPPSKNTTPLSPKTSPTVVGAIPPVPVPAPSPATASIPSSSSAVAASGGGGNLSSGISPNGASSPGSVAVASPQEMAPIPRVEPWMSASAAPTYHEPASPAVQKSAPSPAPSPQKIARLAPPGDKETPPSVAPSPFREVAARTPPATGESASVTAAAQPVPFPSCNSTGALGTTMGGCSPPSPPPSLRELPTPASGNAPFPTALRFHIKTGKRHPMDVVRRNIAAWIGKRVIPHPTPREVALLNNAILSIPQSGFPVSLEESAAGMTTVTVEADTLNDIAARLRQAVSSGQLSYRVKQTAVTGGTPGENRFVEENLSIPPSAVVTPHEVSDSLYAVSQVPGFARADALFSPLPDSGEDLPSPSPSGTTEPLSFLKERSAFFDSLLVEGPALPSLGTPFAPQELTSPPANLLVHVTPAPTFAGSQIEVDNYGYAPTGALMLNATGTVNNAGIAGGIFTVVASTSFGGMNAGTLSYSLPIDLMNRVGADFNAMNYVLGNGLSPWGNGANAAQLTALGVSGSNYSGDVWGMQTFIEKPDRKLVLKETLFLKEFQDTYSQTSQNDRSLPGGTLDLSGFRTLGKLTASFDLADTEYDLSQGAGSNPANPFYYDTQGLQNYMTANGQLSYAVTPVWSVTLGTVDQQYIGGGTLDPMLQATLGGVANVMALPTASLFGNDLYVGTLTLTRTDAVRTTSFASSLFFDAGQVTGIGTNYSALGPGVEESVSVQHWFARGDLAFPVGALPTQILGQNIPAMAGGNIGQGGLPFQLWLSAGLRY